MNKFAVLTLPDPDGRLQVIFQDLSTPTGIDSVL
jgi:hypothetical protein